MRRQTQRLARQTHASQRPSRREVGPGEPGKGSSPGWTPTPSDSVPSASTKRTTCLPCGTAAATCWHPETSALGGACLGRNCGVVLSLPPTRALRRSLLPGNCMAVLSRPIACNSPGSHARKGRRKWLARLSHHSQGIPRRTRVSSTAAAHPYVPRAPHTVAQRSCASGTTTFRCLRRVHFHGPRTRRNLSLDSCSQAPCDLSMSIAQKPVGNAD